MKNPLILLPLMVMFFIDFSGNSMRLWAAGDREEILNPVDQSLPKIIDVDKYQSPLDNIPSSETVPKYEFDDRAFQNDYHEADGHNFGVLKFRYFDFYTHLMSQTYLLLLYQELNWNKSVAWISREDRNGLDITGYNFLALGRSDSLAPSGAPRGAFYLMSNLLLDMKIRINFVDLQNPINLLRLNFFYFY